jgi:hypothetical protein
VSVLDSWCQAFVPLNSRRRHHTLTAAGYLTYACVHASYVPCMTSILTHSKVWLPSDASSFDLSCACIDVRASKLLCGGLRLTVVTPPEVLA